MKEFKNLIKSITKTIIILLIAILIICLFVGILLDYGTDEKIHNCIDEGNSYENCESRFSW